MFIGIRSHSAPHQTHCDDDGEDDNQDNQNNEQVVGDGQSVVAIVLGGSDGLDVAGLLDSGELVDLLDGLVVGWCSGDLEAHSGDIVTGQLRIA